MSYERALDLWKAQPVDPPPLSRVERAHRFTADVQAPSGAPASRAQWGLRLAMLGFVLMAVIDDVWRPQDSGRTLAVLLPIILLVIADRRVRLRSLESQMLVRAIAWSHLVIGLVVSVWGFTEFVAAGVPIALGSGLALLALGGRGLGISSGSFRPIAFRMQLLIALVMAMADAETLLFAGIVDASSMHATMHLPPVTWDYLVMVALAVLFKPTIIAGLVMAVAVWGLLRMRTWALFLNLVANFAIAGLALQGTLELTLPVAGVLSTTAVIQLMLVVPILAAAVGDDNPDRPPLRAWGPRVARLVIALAMLASVGGAMIPERVGLTVWRVGWVDRVHRTDWRGTVPSVQQRGLFWRERQEGTGR